MHEPCACVKNERAARERHGPWAQRSCATRARRSAPWHGRRTRLPPTRSQGPPGPPARLQAPAAPLLRTLRTRRVVLPARPLLPSPMWTPPLGPLPLLTAVVRPFACACAAVRCRPRHNKRNTVTTNKHVQLGHGENNHAPADAHVRNLLAVHGRIEGTRRHRAWRRLAVQKFALCFKSGGAKGWVMRSHFLLSVRGCSRPLRDASCRTLTRSLRT